MKKYDVVVVGGGFAGVAAALAARRTGAEVLIVEKNGCLGGAATECLVNPFMPYSTVIDGKSFTEEEELSKLGVLKLIDCQVLENSYLRLRYEVIKR